MYTLVYFSPTGNVLHLAKMLANHLDSYDVEILPLESIKADQLINNKHLVLLYPIHGFNAPRNVKRFVKRLPPGLYNTVSMIGVGCTTSWVNEAASSDLRKLFTKKEYSIILDEILAMPLTIIVSFPDKVANKLITESEERIEDISKSLVEGKRTILKVKGKSRVLSFFGKAETFASRLFGLELYAGNDCNLCGVCWKNCPEKNIERSNNGKPRFGFKCLMCLRCVYSCPQKAINPRLSKFIPIKKGYLLKKFGHL